MGVVEVIAVTRRIRMGSCLGTGWMSAFPRRIDPDFEKEAKDTRKHRAGSREDRGMDANLTI